MSADTFSQKIIEVDLELTVNSFAGGGNAKNIQGLACSAHIVKHGLPSKNTCTIDIYNLKQEDVQRISTTSPHNLDVRKNMITVKAGVAGGQMANVFTGEIVLAHGIYPSADLGVHIEAMTGIFPSLIISEPYTFDGEVSALSIIERYAKEIGYSYRNNGFEDKPLFDPVVNGSPLEKIQQVAAQIGAQILCDDEQIILSPWNKPFGSSVSVTPHNGLLGYPEFHPSGVRFRCVYDPRFRQGGEAEISGSMVERANGRWKIVRLEHRLQCFGAGDAWETEMEGVYPDGA